MKYLTTSYGVILAVMGVLYFYLSGMDRLFMLMPLLFGILVTAFGFLHNRWRNSYPFYGSIMLASLTLIGSLGSLFGLASALVGGEESASAATMVRSMIGILALVYVVLGIVFTDDFWAGWKAFGHFLGDWVGRTVMTLFYFTILLPFGLGVRFFADPLHIKTRPSKLWRPRTTEDQVLEELRRQY